MKKTLCYSISIIHHDDFKTEVRYSSTHSYLVPRLRIDEAIPLFPLYTLMAWTGKALPFTFTVLFDEYITLFILYWLYLQIAPYVIVWGYVSLVFTITFFIMQLLT
jgi:hypothetical protein